MKKEIIILLACVAVISCKSKSSTTVAGSYVSPIAGMEAFSEGVTLNADGSASSINTATLQYSKWTAVPSGKNELIILSGESIGNGQTIPVSDTFTMVKEPDGKTALQSTGGRKLTFTDPARVSEVISEYSTDYCYKNKETADIAELRYKKSGNLVFGSLSYQISGKDKNFGNIKGAISGDTLTADYTFFAEGSESVRQVVLLKSGTSWKEGVGEVEVEGNKARFKDISTLRFDGFSMDSTACN